MSTLWDAIRKKQVEAAPEEEVRQRFVRYLVDDLGYPKGHLAVEYALHHLPYLTSAPKRRADLIGFAKGIHREYSLYPLILVECKAVPLSRSVVNQVVGYNAYVQAPCIVVVNQNELKHAWVDEGYQLIDDLPKYSLLKERAIWANGGPWPIA